jgi:hypothetical protein
MALKLKFPPPVGDNFELRKKLVAISKKLSGHGTNVTIIMGLDGDRNQE